MNDNVPTYDKTLKGKRVELLDGTLARVDSCIIEGDGAIYFTGSSEKHFYFWDKFGKTLSANDHVSIKEVIG